MPNERVARSRAGRRLVRDGYSHSSANTLLNKLPLTISWRLRIRWLLKAWRQPCKRRRRIPKESRKLMISVHFWPDARPEDAARLKLIAEHAVSRLHRYDSLAVHNH